ncbi:hypothetical protein JI721_07185 [Alicyclobacillus cycloheptanicus]|jgi:hypothetical protein|uniref:PH domain-containing protein n=1 Tax=Alicyclobacillus cycloheptanicus TaxID=1457 RepID=A0ABT9XJA6_9BACL|nr:hypothetical protein [Alicyclobacillus cycloheptanicus]MDQ0190205.1 hypothetical protein [Alicyclobacillus cycloheptanicus]WDM02547.1 hypothetical protein JI721_07185 [Alicyclobacillus cycloheptanicus]
MAETKEKKAVKGARTITIPTRENTWMLTWWVPVIVFVVMMAFRHLPAVVLAAADVVLALSFLFALWRLRQKSSLVLTDEAVVAKRGTKVVRTLAVSDVARIVMTRGAVGIYVKNGGRLPKISRGLRFRRMEERATFVQDIARWCRLHKVEFVE